MITLTHKELLDAGVHLGHMTRKWHPNMAPFIFMERSGIHIIDLNKTLAHLQEATQALKSIARTGKKILFVATKKQARNVIVQEAQRLRMPYVTERWLGGTLTNFATIRKLLKKMASFEKLTKETAYKNMAKKEQLTIAREKSKLQRLLHGIADITRLPSALCVVDINKEHIAVKEAQKLGIPVFALVDTNTNPLLVDYPIASNDDASRSIEAVIKVLASAIEEGLEERQKDKATEQAMQETAEKTSRERNVRKVVLEEEISKQVAKSKAATGPKTAKKVVAKKTETLTAAPSKGNTEDKEVKKIAPKQSKTQPATTDTTSSTSQKESVTPTTRTSKPTTERKSASTKKSAPKADSTSTESVVDKAAQEGATTKAAATDKKDTNSKTTKAASKSPKKSTKTTDTDKKTTKASDKVEKSTSK